MTKSELKKQGVRLKKFKETLVQRFPLPYGMAHVAGMFKLTTHGTLPVLFAILVFIWTGYQTAYLVQCPPKDNAKIEVGSAVTELGKPGKEGAAAVASEKDKPPTPCYKEEAESNLLILHFIFLLLVLLKAVEIVKESHPNTDMKHTDKPPIPAIKSLSEADDDEPDDDKPSIKPAFAGKIVGAGPIHLPNLWNLSWGILAAVGTTSSAFLLMILVFNTKPQGNMLFSQMLWITLGLGGCLGSYGLFHILSDIFEAAKSRHVRFWCLLGGSFITFGYIMFALITKQASSGPPLPTFGP